MVFGINQLMDNLGKLKIIEDLQIKYTVIKLFELKIFVATNRTIMGTFKPSSDTDL